MDKWAWLDRSNRLYTLWARTVDACRDKGWSQIRQERAEALEIAMADAEEHLQQTDLAGFRTIADFRRKSGLAKRNDVC